MKTPQRDILVLLRNQFMSEKAIEHHVGQLNKILRNAESPHEFCVAHELVNRNHITSKPHKILDAIRLTELKPFRFLINKN